MYGNPTIPKLILAQHWKAYKENIFKQQKFKYTQVSFLYFAHRPASACLPKQCPLLLSMSFLASEDLCLSVVLAEQRELNPASFE